MGKIIELKREYTYKELKEKIANIATKKTVAGKETTLNIEIEKLLNKIEKGIIKVNIDKEELLNDKVYSYVKTILTDTYLRTALNYGRIPLDKFIISDKLIKDLCESAYKHITNKDIVPAFIMNEYDYYIGELEEINEDEVLAELITTAYKIYINRYISALNMTSQEIVTEYFSIKEEKGKEEADKLLYEYYCKKNEIVIEKFDIEKDDKTIINNYILKYIKNISNIGGEEYV